MGIMSLGASLSQEKYVGIKFWRQKVRNIYILWPFLIYIYIICLPITSNQNAWQKSFGVKLRMSWAYLLPDLLREFRVWSIPSSSCPWGAIGLVVLLVWLAGCCCGAALASLVLSIHCRRLVHLALRVAAQWSAGPVDSPAVATRLREYNRHL